jgi:DNA mismatch repair protein MutS
MDKDLKSQMKIVIDKFLGKENVDEIIKNEMFNSQEVESICLKIFGDQEENKIINKDVELDLELFEGLGVDKNDTIFNYINHTHTKLGNYLLKRLMAQPTNEIQILRARQTFINKINSNKELFNTLDNKLLTIKEKEEDLLWLWKEFSDETKQLFGMVYFQKRFLRFLNHNEFAMKIYNYYVIIFSPLYGILSPILMFLAPFIFLKYYFKTEVSLKLYFRILKVAITGIRNITKVDITQDANISYTQIISVLVWLVFYIHSLFSNIEHAKNTNKICNIIHTKVNNISKLVREGYSLFELTANDINENTKLVPCEVKKVFNVLWKDIFDKQPAFYSNKGILLKTYKDLENKKEKLLDIMKYIGNLDVYLSLSKLMKNSNYCFAEYNEDKVKPAVKVIDMWYPVLEKKKTYVKNSITLGSLNPQNALITGPNAGGKSTFIKSLSLCVLFSQTLSIVPARVFSVTPFTIINTYLNIPDSKGKESLYEAEMRRALEQINKIKELKRDEFSFVILDEIFNSTNPEEGIGAAYAVAEEVASYKNSIALITSHYGYLSKLEETMRYVNYKIPIERDNNNNIVYKYKLVRGISNQFIALELLKKKGFDEKIVKRAQSICKDVSFKKKNLKLRKRKKIITEKPEVSNTEKPEVSNKEKPEVSNTEKPEVSNTEKPEVSNKENPEKPKSIKLKDDKKTMKEE